MATTPSDDGKMLGVVVMVRHGDRQGLFLGRTVLDEEIIIFVQDFIRTRPLTPPPTLPLLRLETFVPAPPSPTIPLSSDRYIYIARVLQSRTTYSQRLPERFLRVLHCWRQQLHCPGCPGPGPR
jgi:hypothetical protein